MLLKELKKSNLPKEFLDSLGSTICKTCGKEMVITESLSQLSCPNKECKDRVASKVYHLLKALNIDWITEKECRKFVSNFDIKNHYAIFDYVPDESGEFYDGFGDDNSEKLYKCINEKRSMKLWQYMNLGFINCISEVSRYLFCNYDNLDKFYEDLNKGSVEFINSLLNMWGTNTNSASININAYNIYRNLIDNEEFYKEYESFVEITHLCNLEYSTITLLKVSEKGIKDLEEALCGVYRFDLIDIVTNERQCAVYENDEDLEALKLTSKYQRCIDLDIPVLTVEDLVNSLKT